MAERASPVGHHRAKQGQEHIVPGRGDTRDQHVSAFDLLKIGGTAHNARAPGVPSAADTLPKERLLRRLRSSHSSGIYMGEVKHQPEHRPCTGWREQLGWRWRFCFAKLGGQFLKVE